VAAHRHWRVWVDYSSTGYTVASEIEMRESVGGGNACGGGTPSASSAAYSQTADLAFDGNAVTYWQSSAVPAWIAYDFGEGHEVDIIEIAWSLPAGNFAPFGPHHFAVQWSDDGSNWFLAWSAYEPGTWASGETRTYARPTDNAIQGDHRFWRIFGFVGGFPTGAYGFANVEFRQTSAGADEFPANGSGITASSEDVAHPATHGCDASVATWWVTPSGQGAAWWKCDFGVGNGKHIAEFAMTPELGTAWAIVSFDLQFSDDGNTWQIAASFRGLSWGVDETKVWTMPWVIEQQGQLDRKRSMVACVT
jgi:hypothetical protein